MQLSKVWAEPNRSGSLWNYLNYSIIPHGVVPRFWCKVSQTRVEADRALPKSGESGEPSRMSFDCSLANRLDDSWDATAFQPRKLNNR